MINPLLIYVKMSFLDKIFGKRGKVSKRNRNKRDKNLKEPKKVVKRKNKFIKNNREVDSKKNKSNKKALINKTAVETSKPISKKLKKRLKEFEKKSKKALQKQEKSKKPHLKVIEKFKGKEKEIKEIEKHSKKDGNEKEKLTKKQEKEIKKQHKNQEKLKENPVGNKSQKLTEKKIKNQNKDFKSLMSKNKQEKSSKKIDKSSEGFIKTFVPGFDKLIDPGLPEGAAILIEGGPGSGKTLWCLTFLKEMVKRGKKVLFMSFEEPEERLRKHIDESGINSLEYEKKGLLYLKRFNALDIARSVEALLSEAKKELLIDVQPVLIPKDFEPDIVIVDSLSSISSAFSGEASRFRIYMEQLFRYLEGHHITSLLIREVSSPTHIGRSINGAGGEAVSFLSDGIIAIYNVIYTDGHRKRALEILKMRGVHIDRKIVEYEILKEGVIVFPNKLLKGDYKLT